MARLAHWQCGVCVLGMLACWLPGVSWEGLSSGLEYSSSQILPQESKGVTIDKVQPGSQAERAGFRAGDVVQTPRDFDRVREAFHAVQGGESQTFTLRRGESSLQLTANPAPRSLAAVWYTNWWHPVAGGIFFALTLLLIATGPIQPAPWWRSLTVLVIGFGLAVGFAVSMATTSVFARWVIYSRFPMGSGEEWHQFGLVPLVAGMLLALLAALEIRQHFKTPTRQGQEPINC